MSFLSSIASDIKSLASDPGKIAKDVCDAVLPSNMKAVGDVVGSALDVETGHPLQALSHMADALKDLPQMAQGLPGTTTTAGKGASTPAGTAAAEPTPPPTRAPSLQQVISELTALAGGGSAATGQSTGTTKTATTPRATTADAAAAPTTAVATTAATATATTPAPATVTTATTSAPAAYSAPSITVSSQVPTRGASRHPELSVSLNVDGTTVTVTEDMGPRLEGQHDPATGRTTWQAVPTQPTFTVTTSPASTTSAGAPATAAAPTSTASTAPAAPTSAATSAATSGTSSTPSTTTTGTATASTATAAGLSSAGAASATGPAGTGSTATPSSLSSLMSMSNDQFMQAVTSGNIPADVANNPSAMAEIQARMNQITQMNQLVTSMMAAMHQMQMAIIQNIRV